MGDDVTLLDAWKGGRIGKTALWGYAYDNPSANRPDTSLAEFEGAHRMVWAEYCGDGKS